MKTLIMLWMMLVLPIPIIFGQMLMPELLASSGAEYSDGSVSMSWSLGELAVHSLTADQGILTQGYQQGNLTITSVRELENGLNCSIYPNPTSERITMELDAGIDLPVNVELFNTKGQIILQKQFLDLQNDIDFTHLPPGLYYIRMSSKDRLKFQTYKVNVLR